MRALACMRSRIRISRGIYTCPSCGLTLPGLETCSMTGLCLECSRARLGSVCDTCPERDRCDAAIRGLRLIRRLEPGLDAFVDVSRALIDVAKRALPGDAAVDAAVGFMRALSGFLAVVSSGEDPREALVAWIRAVFTQYGAERAADAPLVIDPGEVSRFFKYLCARYRCSDVVDQLSMLFAAYISAVSLDYALGRFRGINAYIRLGES